MQAGCYTLDLYCDHPECPVRSWAPHMSGTESPLQMKQAFEQITHELGSVCRKIARKRGWKLAKTSEEQDLCPVCVKRTKSHG